MGKPACAAFGAVGAFGPALRSGWFVFFFVDGKYYFTAKGKYYYRQMDRVLLTAAECVLYGKPGLMEQAGQKMMGIMKNMK